MYCKSCDAQEEEFDEVRLQIENNGRVLNELMVLMKHLPLTVDEVFKLQDESKLQGRKAQQYHDDVLARFDKLEFMLNCLGNKILTQEESKRKDELLKILKIESADLLVTDTIIGQGGFGEVRIGFFKGVTKVGVKMAKTDGSSDNSLFVLFQNELLLMQYLGNDPHILTLYGFVKDRKGMQLVMELSPYGALSKIVYDIASFPLLPSSLCLLWLRDISLAMDHIHKKEVKHKDIKAENVLVFPGLSVKLCDFGLAKQHNSYQSTSHIASYGTMGFIAPEIRNDQKSTLSVDVYSFAMTAIQILSRSHPLMGDPLGQIDKALKTISSTLPFTITENLRELLFNCVKYDATEMLKPDMLRPNAKAIRQIMVEIVTDPGVKLDIDHHSHFVDVENVLQSISLSRNTIPNTAVNDSVESPLDVQLLPLTIQSCYYFLKLRALENEVLSARKLKNRVLLQGAMEAKKKFSDMTWIPAFKDALPIGYAERSFADQYKDLQSSIEIEITNAYASDDVEFNVLEALEKFTFRLQEEFPYLKNDEHQVPKLNKEEQLQIYQEKDEHSRKDHEQQEQLILHEKREQLRKEEQSTRDNNELLQQERERLREVQERRMEQEQLHKEHEKQEQIMIQQKKQEQLRIEEQRIQEKKELLRKEHEQLVEQEKQEELRKENEKQEQLKQLLIEQEKQEQEKQEQEKQEQEKQEQEKLECQRKEKELQQLRVEEDNAYDKSHRSGRFCASNDSLRVAVKLWRENRSLAVERYGHISTWDTSCVTDMSHLLQHYLFSFDDDITVWDVSNVTTMKEMFWGLRSFNQDLSRWNVSNVRDMEAMFRSASSFNQNLSQWDVSHVTNMTEMFRSAESFNQDISTWNVSSVVRMNYMFYEASLFNQDVTQWDVSNVTTMSNMFNGAVSFNQDLTEWDVSNVLGMNGMFHAAKSFRYKNKCKQLWPVARKSGW